ncbi:MAG: type II toxin-antitoxin system PemK/MazF family toxin [Verrucomicrobia bacterium]|nr:type II toxin-antitoxin system PemK/MazF family toxin [Verrucomicrobiota bacterium]
MNQWDIFVFPFDRERRHPAVILSNDETCQNPDIEEVNALLCTSARVNRGPKPTEEVLEETDGMDWKTMVRCDKIYLLPKDRFQEKKGSVSHERRVLIARKIVEVLRLPLHR